VLAAAILVALGALPARAALSNVSLVASNNQVSSSSTYTVTYQVGVADLGLLLVLPSGVTGLAAGNVTVTKSTDGTTFASVTPSSKLVSADGQRLGVNLPSALAAGNWVKVTITGLTNPSSTGDYTVQLGGDLLAITQAQLDGVLATLLALMAETANVVLTVVSVVTNAISTNLNVAPALTFSVGTGSHTWNLDPSGTTSSNSVSDSLTIATNAATYVIQAFVSGNLVRAGTDGSQTSDVISHTAGASGPHFGYTVTGPAGDAVAGTYRTFDTSSTNLVSGWSLSGLTNSEATTVTYDLGVDYTKSPGLYLGSVTYRIVPTY
jgi:hypothetical protein